MGLDAGSARRRRLDRVVTARLVGGWADLMVEAPPLALVSVLVVVIATVALFSWFRPEVEAAFERA